MASRERACKSPARGRAFAFQKPRLGEQERSGARGGEAWHVLRPAVAQGRAQVPDLGLAKSIERFDLTRPNRFVSYAIPTMEGEIKRHFRDHGWSTYVPRGVKDLHSDVMRTARTRSGTEDVDIAELAADAGLDATQVADVVAANRSFRAASLDSPPLGAEDDGPVYASSVEDPGCHAAEQRAALDTLCRDVELSKQDRRVLHLRFVDDRHQREIADELGCSQMQVSRILRSTFERLSARGSFADLVGV